MSISLQYATRSLENGVIDAIALNDFTYQTAHDQDYI